MKIPSKLAPTQVVAIVDSREQKPLDLAPLQLERNTLATGDYALKQCDFARIERKSLNDLLGCCGRDRRRFDAEIERLRAYPVAVLLIESTWNEIELGQWRSKLTPKQVEGALLGWMAKGIQVEMAGNHERAGRIASRLLFTIARRKYRELRHSL